MPPTLRRLNPSDRADAGVPCGFSACAGPHMAHAGAPPPGENASTTGEQAAPGYRPGWLAPLPAIIRRWNSRQFSPGPGADRWSADPMAQRDVQAAVTPGGRMRPGECSAAQAGPEVDDQQR